MWGFNKLFTATNFFESGDFMMLIYVIFFFLILLILKLKRIGKQGLVRLTVDLWSYIIDVIFFFWGVVELEFKDLQKKKEDEEKPNDKN